VNKYFTLFHCNLMFSSIEKDQRKDVINRCYYQFQRYVENNIKVSIEMTAITLKIVNDLNPEFIDWLKDSIKNNKVEFIGSGYSQIIGPLVPQEVNDYNQKIGQKYYKEILGINPEIALVNEMAFSNGLIESYVSNGYSTILTEWNNALSNLNLNKDLQYFPQKIEDSNGNAINIVLCDSISFQQFQRCIHGDITMTDYLSYIERSRKKSHNGFLAVYSGDAEVFDFRPGRYKNESQIQSNEWKKIIQLHKFLLDKNESSFFIKEIVDEYKNSNFSNKVINLCSVESPIPVKKQSKYNITRWALTGNDDFIINSACYQLFEAIKLDKNLKDFEELIYLWSSDFRTHITDKRWKAYLKRLNLFQTKVFSKNKTKKENYSIEYDSKLIGNDLKIDSQEIKASFNTKKGTINHLTFNSLLNQPLIGTIKHAFYEDINFAADFYSGHTVIERPAKRKITSLHPTSYKNKSNNEIFKYNHDKDNSIVTSYSFNNNELIINKDITCNLGYPYIMKLYNFTFLPDHWDEKTLYYKVCNGGSYETFNFNFESINQQKITSHLISSHNILGNTNGKLEIGDKKKSIIFETDCSKSFPLPYIDYKNFNNTFFLRLSYSSQEIDETFLGNNSNFSSSIKVYGKQNIN
jgi:hypothetical protein